MREVLLPQCLETAREILKCTVPNPWPPLGQCLPGRRYLASLRVQLVVEVVVPLEIRRVWILIRHLWLTSLDNIARFSTSFVKGWKIRRLKTVESWWWSLTQLQSTWKTAGRCISTWSIIHRRPSKPSPCPFSTQVLKIPRHPFKWWGRLIWARKVAPLRFWTHRRTKRAWSSLWSDRRDSSMARLWSRSRGHIEARVQRLVAVYSRR